ncbi:nitrite/sulfite reductase [soil metagenome]
MYKYSPFDQRIVDERVAQFRGQVQRFVKGELTDDELKPLRLQNGLYIQRHSPMLRVAIPYGMLAAGQLRMLASIARRYDRSYAHFTTRQNLQYNWFKLEDGPEMLADLAKVEMHAIQTSGNCIRNITTDPFAGVSGDEFVDPRPYAEILRQWSTFHPEFAYLPRKFKIALTAAVVDRAAVAVHDIGLYLRIENGDVVFDVLAGGGMGRTPIVGAVIRRSLPWQDLLSYCEAVLRVYNRHGRRDNIYKARIKILVRALGADEFARQVEAEWQQSDRRSLAITDAERDRVAAHFTSPDYAVLDNEPVAFTEPLQADRAFSRWVGRSVRAHKVDGYAIVTLSLKPTGVAPGDLTSDQMYAVADLADEYAFGELRVTHEQNLVLADVRQADLFGLWTKLKPLGLAAANVGLLTDVICCPGGDFCALANAKSIPIAEAIQRKFDDLDFQHDIGEITLNMSGCINSCGHHHVGHIGILGVDKQGDEFYQVTLGGNVGPDPETTRIGAVIGPSFSAHEVPDVLERVLAVYLAQRESEDERFVDVVQRLGIAPFKAAVYSQREATHA